MVSLVTRLSLASFVLVLFGFESTFLKSIHSYICFKSYSYEKTLKGFTCRIKKKIIKKLKFLVSCTTT